MLEERGGPWGGCHTGEAWGAAGAALTAPVAHGQNRQRSWGPPVCQAPCPGRDRFPLIPFFKDFILT